MTLPLSSDTARVRDAIAKSAGNITYAAISLGITKPYMMWLVNFHDLRKWARGLREAAGGKATGRPRKVGA